MLNYRRDTAQCSIIYRKPVSKNVTKVYQLSLYKMNNPERIFKDTKLFEFLFSEQLY